MARRVVSNVLFVSEMTDNMLGSFQSKSIEEARCVVSTLDVEKCLYIWSQLSNKTSTQFIDVFNLIQPLF